MRRFAITALRADAEVLLAAKPESIVDDVRKPLTAPQHLDRAFAYAMAVGPTQLRPAAPPRHLTEAAPVEGRFTGSGPLRRGGGNSSGIVRAWALRVWPMTRAGGTATCKALGRHRVA